MSAEHGLLDALPAGHRARLLDRARVVSFPPGTPLFEEGEEAGRLWIVRTGVVGLDPRAPGLRPTPVETFGAGEAVGWSWLVPPHRWRFGARALDEVTAHECDAAAVRVLCCQDPAFGLALHQRMSAELAGRLTAARDCLLASGGAGESEESEESPGNGGAQSHRVGEVMTPAVVAVDRSATFTEIVRVLRRWRVGAVPVVEGDGRVIGVLSEADLLPGDTDRAAPRGKRAEQLMTAPALTVHRDATVAGAGRVMAQRDVKQLPVIDAEGRLAGIVSRGDLLKVFLRPREEIAREVRASVLEPLFHEAAAGLGVRVADGRVTVSGRVPDGSLIRTAADRIRAVDGVVDVRCELTAPAAAA